MKAIKLLFRYLKKHWLLFVITIVMLFTLNYIRSLIPLLIGKVMQIVDKNEYSSNLPEYLESFFKSENKQVLLLTCMIVICLVAIVRDVLNLFVDVNITKVSESVGSEIQTDYFDKVQDLPYTYLNHAETGDLIQRATQDITRFKRFVNNSLLQMVNAFGIVLINGIQMFIINSTFTLIAFIIIPIYFLVSFLYFRSIEKDFTSTEEAEGKMTTVLQENLTGIRVVKAFANEKYEINKFDSSIDLYTNRWAKVNNKMSLFWGCSDFLTYLQLVITFAISIIFVANKQMSFSEACIMFLFVQNIAWPAKNLGRQIADFGKTSICAGRITEILDLKTEYNQDNLLDVKLKGNIKFENVSFSFPDSNIPTLKNINLTINSGETIAIIGKTGSGKSTLINLINRLLDPTEGILYLDNYDIKTLDKKSVRNQVGIILQEPFLFSRTIKENIAIASKNRDELFIRQLAQIASVDEDILNFENQYETMVGERGVTLSGGQKQRIAIARMLAKEKKILIFDDSLSAVDTETDRKIRKALHEKSKETTTIIITHRITTAKDADKIVVIEDGKITNIGTHQQLIKIPGLYKDIWDIQNCFNKSSNEGGEANV